MFYAFELGGGSKICFRVHVKGKEEGPRCPWSHVMCLLRGDSPIQFPVPLSLRYLPALGPPCATNNVSDYP